LYLDDVLPSTGVEIGQAHRPWIDYEEHGGWNYRSIARVFVEDKNGGMDLTNSADIGVNFKTKTPYFSSELGLFNGEGYHRVDEAASATSNNNGLSGEWRLTGHLLGNGKDKVKADKQYANISYFGQQNSENRKSVITGARATATTDSTLKNGDFNWHGVHAVYNQKEFLVAAQYVETQDAGLTYAGKGLSVNAEARITPKFDLIARYDKTDMNNNDIDKKSLLAGGVYHYNKNVNFIGNILTVEELDSADEKTKNTQAMMLTAEVKW